MWLGYLCLEAGFALEVGRFPTALEACAAGFWSALVDALAPLAPDFDLLFCEAFTGAMYVDVRLTFAS